MEPGLLCWAEIVYQAEYEVTGNEIDGLKLMTFDGLTLTWLRAKAINPAN